MIGQFLFHRGDEHIAVFYSNPDPTLSGELRIPGDLKGVHVYDLVGGPGTIEISRTGLSELRIGTGTRVPGREGPGGVKRFWGCRNSGSCTWKMSKGTYSKAATPTASLPADKRQLDGPVPGWLVLGPLEGTDLETTPLPKVELDPRKQVEGKFGKICWQGANRKRKWIHRFAGNVPNGLRDGLRLDGGDITHLSEGGEFFSDRMTAPRSG